VHVTAVLAHGRGAYAYLSGEEWPHDSNLTIECIQRTLKDIERKEGKLPRTLFVQMDNCSRLGFAITLRVLCVAMGYSCLLFRDCKNKYILGYLFTLAARNVFERIEMSYLPVGHTHEVTVRKLCRQ